MSEKYSATAQGCFGAKYDYDVDLVLCIDATGSMKPVFEMVKENALRLSDDIQSEATQNGKVISNLRISVILFRDYLADGVHAMEMTDFFKMPQDKSKFKTLMDQVVADGGGDEPEDALEALAYAIKSDWAPARPGTKRRQIIAVWTDASTHELGFGREAALYDPKLPKDFGELTRWWGDHDRSNEALVHYESKRLALFAPDTGYWKKIHDNWDHVIHYPSIAGQGLDEFGYQEIIHLLVKTV